MVKELPGQKLGATIRQARGVKRKNRGNDVRFTKPAGRSMGLGARKKSSSHGAPQRDKSFNFAPGTKANHQQSPAALYHRGEIPSVRKWTAKTKHQDKKHHGEARSQPKRPCQVPQLKQSARAALKTSGNVGPRQHNVERLSHHRSPSVTTTPTQPKARLNARPQRVARARPNATKPISKTSKRKERQYLPPSPCPSQRIKTRRGRVRSQEGATAASAVVISSSDDDEYSDQAMGVTSSPGFATEPDVGALCSGGRGTNTGARRTGALTQIHLLCVAEVGLFGDSEQGRARACSSGPMTLSVAPDGDYQSPYHVRICFGSADGAGAGDLGAGSEMRLLGFSFNDIKRWGVAPDMGVIYFLLNRPFGDDLGKSVDTCGRWQINVETVNDDGIYAMVAKAQPGALCDSLDALRSLRVNNTNGPSSHNLPSCIAKAWQQIHSKAISNASRAPNASTASITASTGGLRRSRRSSARKQSGGSSAAASDVVHLMYTARGSCHAQSRDTITIYSGDLDRLDEGEFLNDSLVDFWLKYYHVEPEQLDFSDLPLWQRRDMYIFSSYFFTKLRDGVGVEDVDRWADKLPEFDLFAKKLLFVPINESLHWSLAIVVNPCSLVTGRPDARIMVLDSLHCHKPTKVVKLLRKYLFHEWCKREKRERTKVSDGRHCDSRKESAADDADEIGEDDKSDGDKYGRWKQDDFNTLFRLAPANNIPLQNNCCDCGVFVLRYFMMTCDIIRGKRSFDQFWDYFGDEEFRFGHHDVSELRQKIRTKLNELQAERAERVVDGNVCGGDSGRNGSSGSKVLVHSGGGVYMLSQQENGGAKETQ